MIVRTSDDTYVQVDRAVFFAGWCRLYTAGRLAAIVEGHEAQRLRELLDAQAFDPQPAAKAA